MILLKIACTASRKKAINQLLDKNLGLFQRTLITATGVKEEWAIRRQKMLNDKIYVTAFLVWFVENWPESFKVMKEKPEWEERFKGVNSE